MSYSLKITKKEWLTHNAIRFTLDRPEGFQCSIGDAVEVILHSGKPDERAAPFTLTNLYDSKSLTLIIKVYPNGAGFTMAISKKGVGDTLEITDAWPSFEYLGIGTFIAAGSGITPFIPMIEEAKRQNTLSEHRLLYANRQLEDIILRKELEELMGSNCCGILSGEKATGYAQGRMDREFLASKVTNVEQWFYVCGPDDFSNSIKAHLIGLGVDEQKIQIGY